MNAWLFWLLAAFLSGSVVLLLLRPLARGQGREAGRREASLAVLRDQLAEVGRDRAQGLLTESEAAAARLEIERRLLAEAAGRAEEPEPRSPASGRGRGRLAALLVLLLPLAALGLYLYLGQPGVPGMPYAERAEERSARQARTEEMARLVETLRQRMEEAPGDPRGWGLLGGSYLSLGRYEEAAGAFRRGLAAGGEAGEFKAALGEALTLAAGGQVTPEARAAFTAALAATPGEPRARYYLALAQFQAGDSEAALRDWLALAAETPAEAPWRAALLERIAATAESLGRPVPEVPAPSAAATPAPRVEEVEAAQALSPEERRAFVAAMVERLAARLEREPDDPEGWLRLARAYHLLGERAKAEAALERAEALAAELPPEDPRREAVRRGRADLGG